MNTKRLTWQEQIVNILNKNSVEIILSITAGVALVLLYIVISVIVEYRYSNTKEASLEQYEDVAGYIAFSPNPQELRVSVAGMMEDGVLTKTEYKAITTIHEIMIDRNDRETFEEQKQEIIKSY